jgi:hypothetical protein
MISHQKLLLKLQAIGINQHAMLLLHSYLSERQQRVITRDESAEWRQISRGVPQGSCLSPLLFNIYVSDFPEHRDIDVFQFADDTNQSTITDSLDVLKDRLANCFDRTRMYCIENELVINENKTQLIILKQPSKRLPPDFTIHIAGLDCQPLKEVKMLGFTIDRHLTFTAHIEASILKARAALGVLRKAAKWMPRCLRKLAYQALVRSTLEYCCTVFAGTCPTDQRKLETIQRIAARIICDAPRDAHAQPLLEDLQLESLACRRENLYSCQTS